MLHVIIDFRRMALSCRGAKTTSRENRHGVVANEHKNVNKIISEHVE